MTTFATCSFVFFLLRAFGRSLTLALLASGRGKVLPMTPAQLFIDLLLSSGFVIWGLVVLF